LRGGYTKWTIFKMQEYSIRYLHLVSGQLENINFYSKVGQRSYNDFCGG